MPFRLSIATRSGKSPTMAKSRLQICLPEDPFYDLKENRTPARSGPHQTASPSKPLKTPKSSRSKERRLECLQWALETAQEQQIALLGGARTQLEDARGQVAHLEGQLAQQQGQLAQSEGQLALSEGQLAHTQRQLAQSDGQLAQLREQLAYVAECRHSEHSTYQEEVAKLKSENVGLIYENRALAAMTSDRNTEHEKQLGDLVLKHALEREQYINDCARKIDSVAVARDQALAEVQDLTASLESAREGFKGLERERDKLRKEVAGLEGLRNERRVLRADLSSAQQGLKKANKMNTLMAQELKWSETAWQYPRTELETVRKERDGLRGELEREKADRTEAVEKFELAEAARVRARKDLEAAIARLVESQRARAALKGEVAQGLEGLASEQKLREAFRIRASAFEDEARRLRAALQMPPPRFGVSEGPSASVSVTSAAGEKSGPGGLGADKERGDSGQSAPEARPAQGFGGFGGALNDRNVNTFSREAVNVQSGLGLAPSFVFGSANNNPGVRRKSLGGRRKVSGAKKAGTKKVEAPGSFNREEFPSIDGMAGGTKMPGFEGMGHAVPGAADADVSARSDINHVGGNSSVNPPGEVNGDQNSQQENDTCQQKNGAQSGGRKNEGEGKTGSGVLNLKKVVGCLKKHFPGSLYFGRAVKPTEERRVWGFRRAAAPQLQRDGRLRRKNARRLAAEVHLLIGLMVQLERCGIEVGP